MTKANKNIKYIPRIELKEKPNFNKETALFLSFLHHPYYIQNKNFIFQAFPELKKLIAEEDEEKKVIKQFISEFYRKHKIKIQKITQQNKKLLIKKDRPSLIALLEIMDYQYKRAVTYKATPTILPFSPFGNNTFYFSILGEIKGKSDKNILITGLHEISHFIFLKIVKEIENKKKLKVPIDLKNYLKEAIAALVLNQKPLREILKIENYQGNPEIQNLRIKTKSGKIKTFIDFLNEYYYLIKIKGHKSFKVFLEEMIKVLLPLAPDFAKKRIFWNKYGKKLLEKPNLARLYNKPIKI